jgi:hypothetical protein
MACVGVSAKIRPKSVSILTQLPNQVDMLLYNKKLHVSRLTQADAIFRLWQVFKDVLG